MIKLSVVLILSYANILQTFDQNANDIFKSVLGDVESKRREPSKRQLNTSAEMIAEKRPLNTSAEMIAEKRPLNTSAEMIAEKRPLNTSAEMIAEKRPLNTSAEMIADKIGDYNATEIISELSQMKDIPIEKAKFRLLKIKLRQMLERDVSPIPDFSKDADNPTLPARRFNFVRRFYNEANKTLLNLVKRKIYALMEHYIYETRYKLTIIQVLRNKYLSELRYKIGFSFALLRHLSEQERMMFATLEIYYKRFSNLMIHLKIHAKVVRLDVDITDLCRLIRVLDYQRKIKEKPDYYDDYDPKK